MSDRTAWLRNLSTAGGPNSGEGLISVSGYDPAGRPPEEVVMIERAAHYGAAAVFFRAHDPSRPPTAEAFIFVEQQAPAVDNFGQIHRQLWSWGGVPLIYRKVGALVQLFRCGHKKDFIDKDGHVICNPFDTLDLAVSINEDPWWHASRLSNGTLWDDPEICRRLLAPNLAAHSQLFNAIRDLHADLCAAQVLPKGLRRRLLILCLMIEYLQAREALLEEDFARHQPGATCFLDILANGTALVSLLSELESRFNGHVFKLTTVEHQQILESGQLPKFAKLVQGKTEKSGQLTLWKLYSFRDLPVEIISHVYQLFVADTDSSVYTPPFLVRLMLDEALSWERLDRLQERDECILDPSCGSGVFIVESYQRLIIHWRSKNKWEKPSVQVLRSLILKVQGVDLDEGAIELAAFSLCLSLCDSLEPEALRRSKKLFPVLINRTLFRGCFFETKELGKLTSKFGIVVGNPPFESKLKTNGAKESLARYETNQSLPDKQVAYLFLHESMQLLQPGGLLSMLQQYNLLYNSGALEFRRSFIRTWKLREILDFVSVRGIFSKAKADTKVIVVVAEASAPSENDQILHATFRRTGRAEVEKGFEIDYYDLHWLSRETALCEDLVWRANLLGGGRILSLAQRLRSFATIGQYAAKLGWDKGEGFIEGQSGKREPAAHLTGKRYLPSTAIGEGTIDRKKISKVEGKLFKSPYTKARYTAPMLLIREQMDLNHVFVPKGYLTYSQKVVGICAPKQEEGKLRRIATHLTKWKKAMQAYIAITSPGLFTQKATGISSDEIFSLPFAAKGSLDITPNEQAVIDDVVDHYRILVRIGDKAECLTLTAAEMLPKFCELFTEQIEGIYPGIRTLPSHTLDGVICQPFVFGNGEVSWDGSENLERRLGSLLHEQRRPSLRVTRIARIYDGNFLFILKPDRLLHWLPSVALRDADETLADMRQQGF